jgi:hypothetical protein
MRKGIEYRSMQTAIHGIIVLPENEDKHAEIESHVKRLEEGDSDLLDTLSFMVSDWEEWGVEFVPEINFRDVIEKRGNRYYPALLARMFEDNIKIINPHAYDLYGF